MPMYANPSRNEPREAGSAGSTAGSTCAAATRRGVLFLVVRTGQRQDHRSPAAGESSQLSTPSCRARSAARTFVIVGSAANCRRHWARTSGPTPSANAAASSMTFRTGHSSACRMGSISTLQTRSNAALNESQAGLFGRGIRISRRWATCQVGYVNVLPRRLRSINRTGVVFHQTANAFAEGSSGTATGTHQPNEGFAVHKPDKRPLTVFTRIVTSRRLRRVR